MPLCIDAVRRIFPVVLSDKGMLIMKFVSWLQRLRKAGPALPNRTLVVCEKVLKVLAVMPEGPARDALGSMFGALGWTIVFADTPATGIASYRATHFPVVLYEREKTGYDWRLVVSVFARLSPPPSVILLSAGADRNLWDEVIRCGGADILRIPFDEAAVTRVVKAGWTLWRNQENLRQPITPLRTA